MYISEALRKLTGLLDMLSGTGFLTDEELIEYYEMEKTIFDFVINKED